MNRELAKDYINAQPVKIVSEFDLARNRVAYTVRQGRAITEMTGDEEIVRAYILTRLVNELGYASDRIEIEHEYTAGRPHTITSRIDTVVRDAAGNAFLFMELKSPTEYAIYDKDRIIEEQLFKLAGMERNDGHEVKYLVLYTTGEIGGRLVDECIIIDNAKHTTFADWVAADRESVNALPARYGRAQKVPYVKASEKDLETDFTHETLDRLKTDLHNVLWGGGGTDDNDVFSSLTNLILAKIQDEDEKDNGQTYLSRSNSELLMKYKRSLTGMKSLAIQ